jgi:hypothetical protein
VDGVETAPAVARARRHAERDLSALAVAIEFTLISVMVGVVLFPLTEVATELLRDLHFEFWPYLACGLALTLLLWASVIGHSLTFIGWPIDLGHNLLYIVLAVVLAIQMHFAADPVGWFATSALASAVASLTVFYDRRLIGHRLRLARGATADLFRAVLVQQQAQLLMTPLFLLVGLVPLGLLLVLPEVFLHRPGHLVLIVSQLLAVLWALAHAVRTFGVWAEPIVSRAVAELEPEDVAS